MARASKPATNKRSSKRRAFAPVHPGEVILADYLEPLGMSRYALAKALGITHARLGEIIRGRRAIMPDTALRLARYFGATAEFWIGMQAQYDLEARSRVTPLVRKSSGRSRAGRVARQSRSHPMPELDPARSVHDRPRQRSP